jgi:hypothetical protein
MLGTTCPAAELAAIRTQLLRSLVLAPDDFAGREPLWMELHRLQCARRAG